MLALPPSPARAPCSHPQTGPPDSATSPVIVLYSRALCARLCVLALPPSPAGFLMSAHLSRLRLFQRHLRSLVWVGVWVWDWIHAPPRTRSPSSRHPLFTHYPFPPRSLVCGGQPSPHKPRLVVSHSTCPPLSSSPHAHSFVIGPAVINTHTRFCVFFFYRPTGRLRHTSLPLECHRKPTTRKHSGSSARHSTTA